ncbi:MAG TPA: O-linked N-acetylglucosamine transferase, SPINDLY family protein [Oscillatoriaceae cyanobacterium M33_DOE_052]|uniref:O-linked N-acetylglucosamine transferase, SPINDLY family protein n=1 Tax=Planktothricoides sp. SpSt-374 TaxID=2282167 RepID=A0A7C3VKS3_9CYAN|nr:O-linked N-acetylglucosamine transferase, SPINDLY family protein [Oscillatoriaceae cyanobacterium M33_DOE_052]
MTNERAKEAYQYWMQGDYAAAAALYEEAVAANPDQVENYWYLGLMLLLQESAAEALTAWSFIIAQGEPEQVAVWSQELWEVLAAEAERQEAIPNWQAAWLIRQQMGEMEPDNWQNLVQTIKLEKKLAKFPETEELLSQLSEIVAPDGVARFGADEMQECWRAIMQVAAEYPMAVKLADACIAAGVDGVWLAEFLSHQIADFIEKRSVSKEQVIEFTKIGLKVAPENRFFLGNIARFCREVDNPAASADAAIKLLSFADNTVEAKIIAYHLAITSLLETGFAWERAYELAQEYEKLLTYVTDSGAHIAEDVFAYSMVTLGYLPYFGDRPQNDHQFKNQFAQVYQNKVKNYLDADGKLNREEAVSREVSNKVLRIGYISSCFYRHSVGWLSRWVMQYHDAENFAIYTYSLQRIYDDMQASFAEISKFSDCADDSIKKIAEYIGEDEIDILVDLDSITHRMISPILALKPAPIQVTWLGSDASGLPAVDYFIADKYVLPENAQDYYNAKIWRLPQTYIAVDGFEVGVPNVRRDDLGIPDDAVVYFSAQTGYKRNPHNARLQMQIIKAVPDSYFVVKSMADTEGVKVFFENLAAEVGVEAERLRFLPKVSSENLHRANLSIADVVLDTYPYNGATTTLETLWMGIPIVTRVGEQFAARNSYTMMMNVGVTEGIAWTDEEYVEWGIRLGKSPELRQDIAWRLRQSRHSSPLWNSAQFTRDMESAYRQMWQQYVDG